MMTSLFARSSKILFKTAGVLLDEMLDKGLNALKYKVIILDEVHERSVESDLVLVCIKQFLMKNNDLRLHPFSLISCCSFKVRKLFHLVVIADEREITLILFRFKFELRSRSLKRCCNFFLQGGINVCNC